MQSGEQGFPKMGDFFSNFLLIFGCSPNERNRREIKVFFIFGLRGQRSLEQPRGFTIELYVRVENLPHFCALPKEKELEASDRPRYKKRLFKALLGWDQIAGAPTISY